jgi:thiol-disulfide isomerase/thioredoxin
MPRPIVGSATVLSLAVMLSGCASGIVLDASREDLIPVQAGELPAQDVQTRIIPAEDRGDSLQIVGVDADGAIIDTRQLRGTPLVINAWASWCSPCVDEAPILAKAAQSGTSRAAYLGIRVMDSTREPPPALAALPFASLIDGDGSLLASIPGVPPRALPSTTVLDAEGRIAAQRIGPLTTQILDEMLTAARS